MPMTESEWLNCTDPTPMLEFLRGKASDRKLRLFAVACCRRIWHLLHDERSRKAVEVAEQFADGEVALEDLRAAWEAATMAAKATIRGMRQSEGEAKVAIQKVARAAWEAAWGAKQMPGFVVKEGGSLVKKGWAEQAPRFHDIFGNPFRLSPPLPHAVLTWNDRTIPRIAEGIYEERRMPEGTLDTGRLAILHDALLDAGCDNEDLLTHLLSRGPHVRGCWPVDLILGKE
jgi:hypothetical protein